MSQKLNWIVLAAAFAVLAFGTATQADVFNMGAGLTSLEFVSVGNPGNTKDPWTGFGSVADPYLIGRYEVTNAQWREFLTAKARVGDPYELYSTSMAGTFGGIDRSGFGTVEDPYVYSAKGGDANWDNRPVNYVDFWDTARFCNWLHNGQGSGDTESGAYVNIGSQLTFARQTHARYFLPTENQWYKAAYHKNDGVTANYLPYPTSSDAEPINDLIDPDPGNNANYCGPDYDYTVGSPYYTTLVGEFENSESPYGTFDQGGNLWEWIESYTYPSPLRRLRGGDWSMISTMLLASVYFERVPTDVHYGVLGCRVASVPEPGSITLLVCGAIAGLMWCRRRT